MYRTRSADRESVTCSHQHVCSQVGLKEVEDILRDVDLNGDGLVDFEGEYIQTQDVSILLRVLTLHYSTPHS